MNAAHHPPTECHHGVQPAHSPNRFQDFLRRWVLANTVVAGVFALLWLLLRSGSKPSRFVYPCQQAAVSAATLAFGGPLVSALLAARRTIAAGLSTPHGIAVAALGLVATLGLWGYFSRAAAYQGPELDPPPDYRAQVFHVTNCPPDPDGDRFAGVDNLLTLMGREGLKFYRSDTESLLAGADGIIAANDVVVIKINYQWPQRGGTNTDLLRGLIRRIVGHPDTFTGEIVVCENAQFNPIDGFDRSQNNAQDVILSPHDVVVGYESQGHRISHYDWTVRRYTLVDEYSAGDMTDGYVRYDYDAELHGRVSYPKFRTDYGTYISLKYGIWDSIAGTYDRQRLKFINMPVLKSHHATYGATACVKSYMGVVTRELSTGSHSAIAYGILGALMGEIQPADLNILDAIWINANPYGGPRTEYQDATRRDELVASVDPVAADIWAVTNILIPGFIDRSYEPPWPSPSADPDLPTSAFRNYLDNSMNYILAAGYEVTNDLAQIDAITWDGRGDADGDADVDLDDYVPFAACLSTAGPGLVTPPGCEDWDLTGSGGVDLRDFARWQTLFTGPAE